MYTESNKGFTVITNFGCSCNCKYCITKHHPILQNQITDLSKIDWEYLEQCISESTAPTVNISGGGDPFFNWCSNLDFFERLYELAHKYGKELDVHTRILPESLDLISKFRKIALSIEMNDTNALEHLKAVFPSIRPLTKVRVVNVINESVTRQNCIDFIKAVKNTGVEQVTFRQMFGNRKAYENFNLIKDTIREDGVLFLKDGEYHNYFFTTNNKLYPYFFGYTEEDRKVWMKKYEDIEQSCG